jgi:hypothetical protein
MSTEINNAEYVIPKPTREDMIEHFDFNQYKSEFRKHEKYEIIRIKACNDFDLSIESIRSRFLAELKRLKISVPLYSGAFYLHPKGYDHFPLYNKECIKTIIDIHTGKFDDNNKNAEGYDSVLKELNELLDPKINPLINVDATKLHDQIQSVTVMADDKVLTKIIFTEPNKEIKDIANNTPFTITVDLSEYANEKRCALCKTDDLSTTDKWYENVTDKMLLAYKNYRRVAKKRFGNNSIPVCCNCWATCDGCNGCGIPTGTYGIGSLLLYQTTFQPQNEEYKCTYCAKHGDDDGWDENL